VLCLRDPDGLVLELVADEAVEAWPEPWQGPIPADQAIRGLHGVTLWVDSGAEWHRLLATALGLGIVTADADHRLYAVPGGGLGACVGARILPDAGRGLTTRGYVHHTAFRVPDGELDRWRSRLGRYAARPGPVEDHVYYRAVHFDGPEGVRLELASDGPGVSVDEPSEELGTSLVLPPWLEERRAYLERRLPPLRLPGKITTKS
jgi:glyoxalase family protein